MEKSKEYYEGLDKRTNEYKDYKKSLAPTQEALTAKHKANPTIEVTTGLGDVVEKITKATGIKSIVDWFTPEGEDCGCDERKEKLNKIPALKSQHKIECLTVEEYNYMHSLFVEKKKRTNADMKKLRIIWYRVFNKKGVSSCSGCSMTMKTIELEAIFRTYE
jgi:hypothetical protein